LTAPSNISARSAARRSCQKEVVPIARRAEDVPSAVSFGPLTTQRQWKAYLCGSALGHPSYMDTGIKALQKALLRARINVYDECTVALFSCLQNVHDAFGMWEWTNQLMSIAREFNLSAEKVYALAA
jgi:hypothetical protein